ncbi:MAG: flap endonuclease [Candidatus Krumholzibacteria bacterium]|nr:flap endonuclease [Candidatus Krumholzibacteria bacterium]MDH4337350.1 flap endonuclease [Candidatus Krumholzibacteria bacterium]MDH5270111.1 flap endonuclease [Candidatus Krumholzibacteria bacterium]
MNVHLVDGTYELFRHYYALPSRLDADGNEVGALVGVLNSIAAMLRDGATHVGVATDHVVESFRNQMYAGYKTGEGIDPALWRQFHPLEAALRAMGVVVWAMVEEEADDGLAAAAARAQTDPRVKRIFICTPDKDLAQCVRGDFVVQFDRRRGAIRNEDGVREKFGVGPLSIPDYLGLVGDASDGFPGVPRWGAKSASAVLARYEHLEAIPHDPAQWEVPIRGAVALAASLREHEADARLFRDIATLRTDAPVFESVDELEWRGPTDSFAALCGKLGVPDLAETVSRLRA